MQKDVLRIGQADGRARVVIENVCPQIDGGRFPAKRVAGDRLRVEADIFADGHDEVRARILYRREGEEGWSGAPLARGSGDRWGGAFPLPELGRYVYILEGWVDHFATWQEDLKKKWEAAQEVGVELQLGAGLVAEAAARARGTDADRLGTLSGALARSEDREAAVAMATGPEITRLMAAWPDRSLSTRYESTLPVVVEPRCALFSTWYELFPRSCREPGSDHGTFRECERRLSEIARMGFDTLYLPPIHPIGRTNRKGRDNATTAGPEDPGSPWAIGGPEGGHKAVHPRLGTLEDFDRLVASADEQGLRVAIDLAFQCSPEHPYVREHPEWFRWRPDGTIQFAENPPKRYEDIVPFDFECDDWASLWKELKSVVEFWVGHGVRVFRVDNPHTKPFVFWEWLIGEVKRSRPEVLFLAEAFTRPAVMKRLAKLGFSQSYTYFTWRNTRAELSAYLTELTQTEIREYFRPNFWPNTPDILPEYLQYGGRAAFVIRLILAATLSSNYGVYGPAFELCAADALPGREEYRGSEKYEIRDWETSRPESLRELITRVNRIRREHPALQTTWNLRFYETDNDNVLFYGKTDDEGEDALLVAVSLDPFHAQVCELRVPLEELGIVAGQPYLVHDLLGEDKFIWHSDRNRLDLDPQVLPARIFRVRTRLRRERDFDYFL